MPRDKCCVFNAGTRPQVELLSLLLVGAEVHFQQRRCWKDFALQVSSKPLPQGDPHQATTPSYNILQHLTTSYNILQPSKDHNANPHYVILCLHLDICSTRLFFIRIQTFSRASWPRSKRDSLAQTDLQIKLKQEGSQKVRGMITGESSRKKTAWAK